MARIMIADDSAATRLVLKDSIQIGDHELVAEARDGVEAIDKFNAMQPDVLLLDISMPEKDGISVLKEIMSTKPKAKVIMITADEKFSSIHQSTLARAQAYVMKPFNSKDVLDAIAMALD